MEQKGISSKVYSFKRKNFYGIGSDSVKRMYRGWFYEIKGSQLFLSKYDKRVSLTYFSLDDVQEDYLIILAHKASSKLEIISIRLGRNLQHIKFKQYDNKIFLKKEFIFDPQITISFIDGIDSTVCTQTINLVLKKGKNFFYKRYRNSNNDYTESKINNIITLSNYHVESQVKITKTFSGKKKLNYVKTSTGKYYKMDYIGLRDLNVYYTDTYQIRRIRFFDSNLNIIRIIRIFKDKQSNDLQKVSKEIFSSNGKYIYQSFRTSDNLSYEKSISTENEIIEREYYFK